MLAQYRLTTFREHSRVPTTAIQVQQSVPTGKYDQLGSRPSDGLGTGSDATTLALNSQTYFWLPNGRILRMRSNVAETLSSGVDVKDVSVYGTAKGFRGRAEPVLENLVSVNRKVGRKKYDTGRYSFSPIAPSNRAYQQPCQSR